VRYGLRNKLTGETRMGVGKPHLNSDSEISNMVKAYKLSTEISYKFGVQVPRAQRNPCNWIQRIRTPYGQNPSKPNSNRSMIMKRSGAREPRAHATGLNASHITVFTMSSLTVDENVAWLPEDIERTPKGIYTQESCPWKLYAWVSFWQE
jgi:hypothetical protein